MGVGQAFACTRKTSTSGALIRHLMINRFVFFGTDIVTDLAATSREAARSLMAVVVRNEGASGQSGAFGPD